MTKKIPTPSAAAELRDLAATLLEISADARKFSNDLARSITDSVALQCEALEDRAKAVLSRLEGVERLN